MTPLLPLAEAQQRLLALAPPVAVEQVQLAEAKGRWASADIVALRTQPAYDLSAMDGYAIRFADMPGPWEVIGESAAGRRRHCEHQRQTQNRQAHEQARDSTEAEAIHDPPCRSK